MTQGFSKTRHTKDDVLEPFESVLVRVNFKEIKEGYTFRDEEEKRDMWDRAFNDLKKGIYGRDGRQASVTASCDLDLRKSEITKNRRQAHSNKTKTIFSIKNWFNAHQYWMLDGSKRLPMMHRFRYLSASIWLLSSFARRRIISGFWEALRFGDTG